MGSRVEAEVAAIAAGQLGLAIDHAVRDGRSSPIFLAKRLEDRRGRGSHGTPLVASLLLDSGGHS